MNDLSTLFLSPDREGIARAAEILGSGGLVAVPTETVYGLAADATNDLAVAKVFEAKGRPQFNPLIVHLPDLKAAESLADIPAMGHALASAFWPGPLTLVLPQKSGAPISPLVSAGLDSIAIRIPANTATCALLRRLGRPIAAPSANPSGRISPTTAQHVADGLGDRVDGILDCGHCSVGVESTIIGLTGDQAALLRPGGLPVEVIERCIGVPVRRKIAQDKVTAPGQMSSHYAPRARVRLNAETKQPGEILIGFGQIPDADLNLSVASDLTEAAANLFATLHKADRMGGPIAFAPIPETGLGLAINDRLKRAAAPR